MTGRFFGGMLRLATFAAVLQMGAAQAAPPAAEAAIEIRRGVVYGDAVVLREGKKTARELWMDVFLPEAKGDALRPAIIFTFGGAYHRGGPRKRFDVNGAQTTAPTEYCRRYAERGIACFAIDYRLTQERPLLSGRGYAPDQVDAKGVLGALGQVNFIRRELGLPALSPESEDDRTILVNGVIAAAEDLSRAVEHVRSEAERYGVDPNRLFLQGFSAGAIASLSVAHAMEAPVAGVVMNSGGVLGLKLSRKLGASSPPLLMIVGEHDLPGIAAGAPRLLRYYRSLSAPASLAWVPGAGHYYTIGATTLGADGTRLSLEERVVDFLERAAVE